MDAIMNLVWLVICLAPAVGLYKIFEKMGFPGWQAIVPIMNLWVWAKKMELTPWFMFIPFLNFYLIIMLMVRTAQAFGKSSGFAIGMICLPFVFLPMLGFSDATFQGAPKKDAPAAA